jgi:hypothetical protein
MEWETSPWSHNIYEAGRETWREGIRGFGITLSHKGPAPLILREPRYGTETDDEDLNSYEVYKDRLLPLRAFRNERRFLDIVDRLLTGRTAEPLILEVSTPEPLARSGVVPVGPGDRLRCTSTRQKGTLGPTVKVTEEEKDGFITAGHMTAGKDSLIELQHRKFRWKQVGTVIQHADPATSPGTAGWDYAVVELDSGYRHASTAKSTIDIIPAHLSDPLSVRISGAESGDQVGAIVGSLRVYGSPMSRLWNDSWLLMPSAIAAPGDSGAVVVNADSGNLIGIVVGGSMQVSTKKCAIQYVQDLASIDLVLRESEVWLTW